MPRDESAGKRQRVTAFRNTDFPDGYPWPWTAALDQWDDEAAEYVRRAMDDGDTPEEAICNLRADHRVDDDARVEVRS